jgi:predicted DNA-binding transcriptional regulator AlpA
VSLPDSTLRAQVAAILEKKGATKNAARLIRDLMERDRFVDLKVAPEKLGISRRTFYRRLHAGAIQTVTVGGRRMVDLVGTKWHS